MEKWLRKMTIPAYWIILAIHCVLQHYHSNFVALTKPFLLPLLILYLFLRDPNIGSPVSKFIFYLGLFLAFFGDVLLIMINDTFFLSGMIAFMLMNLAYSTSFFMINPLRIRKLLPALVTLVVIGILGYYFYDFLKEELGDYTMPIIVYMITLSVMAIAAVNLITSQDYSGAAVKYLVPGALVFIIENILVALNKFHWDRNRDIFVIVMITYGIAQFLMVRGIESIFLTNGTAPKSTA